MPTPTAPPNTDNAVRSMPTEDSASNKPTNMSNARTVLLITLRSDKSLPVADFSKRDSSAAEIHSVTINTKYQLVVIYRPLSHPYFEKMMVGMRTRFGTMITPVQQTLRDMVAKRSMITATAFIADQTPSPEGAYWTTFLNQDTPVFWGTEKIAQKLNYPVVYVTVNRIKRGYYVVNTEYLVKDPKNTQEGEISELHTKKLEKGLMPSKSKMKNKNGKKINH
jgi:hypothetical protein